MIFLCGIPSEPSLGLVIEQVANLGAPHIVFYQRHFPGMNLEFELEDGRVDGWMQWQGRSFRLEQFTSIYTRLMSCQLLPEMEREPPHSPARLHGEALHTALTRWFDIAPGRVLNRQSQNLSNFSKPHQAQIIRRSGFAIPETLITNDPDLVREFLRAHGRVIYKSISYVRSIVQTLDEADLRRLPSIYWCPVQFQQYVDGDNVRVHAVGERVFATAIHSSSTDYRYSYLEGQQEQLEPIELPEELAGRCVQLSRALGLELAGIDLKITPAGDVYCLEVNPSPAFSYYELHTRQPIALGIARYLAETC